MSLLAVSGSDSPTYMVVTASNAHVFSDESDALTFHQYLVVDKLLLIHWENSFSPSSMSSSNRLLDFKEGTIFKRRIAPF
jgi:hypothetical protein